MKKIRVALKQYYVALDGYKHHSKRFIAPIAKHLRGGMGCSFHKPKKMYCVLSTASSLSYER